MIYLIEKMNTPKIKTKKKSLLTAGLVLLIAASTVVVIPAQITAQNTPPDDFLPNFPMKPKKTPIDGGLTLLAAAGGGYAIKKLRDKKK